MAAPPRVLLEELVEEILLRFPLDDPARLVHAALVCKRWCAIVSGAGFHRRFRKFHRTPPLLGFVSDMHIQRHRGAAEFVPIRSLPGSASPMPTTAASIVLLHNFIGTWVAHWSIVLTVWDPTTDKQEEVPAPPVVQYTLDWTAAVLCAASGPCDHLDCGQGPFQIIFVGYDFVHKETVLCTYLSSAASWSKPISSNQLPYGYGDYMCAHIAHLESALYFGAMTDRIHKFDLGSQEISWIQLPATFSSERPYVLTTTEGAGLAIATILESSKLYMWSRDVSEVDATWTQSRVIELKTLLPVHAVLDSPRVLGFTVSTCVIFVESNNVLFAIDLKTHKVIKEVSEASEIYKIVPYMSFYTPALVAVSTGEER